MGKGTENYKYLLRLYSQVDDYLADVPSKQETLPETIVAFCVVTEKLFKIKLHIKNPILVYENSKTKENDALVAIVKEKELNIETIKIRETLDRYQLMFENSFSDDEVQVLIDIYNVRNHFIHGYKSDDSILTDRENMVKKMGTVWEKISAQAVSIFGNELIKANKPKKKYSEEELEKVLIEEVKTKIKSTQSDYSLFRNLSAYSSHHYDFLTATGEKCPRCDSYGFSLESSVPDIYSVASAGLLTPVSRNYSDLYKCKSCNLELTRKEYEIAVKLKA